MSKLITEEYVNGVPTLRNWTAVNGAEARIIHNRLPHMANDGKFWVWNTIPPGQVIGADFSSALTPAATSAETQQLVDAFKAAPTHQPLDVLIYA